MQKKLLTKFNTHLQFFFKNSSEKAYTSGIYLNITKATYSKPTANIIFSSEKLKAFPLNQEQDKDVRFQHRFGSASQGNQRIK